MYSFAMFLYELVTGGTKPFEDLRFRHELDAAVLKGRALDPITSSDCPPWPDMADLIAHALEPQPHRRVTAEQVNERVYSYCLCFWKSCCVAPSCATKKFCVCISAFFCI